MGLDWDQLVCQLLTSVLYQHWLRVGYGTFLWNENWQGNQSTQMKPPPVPFFPTQIPHDPGYDHTQAATVGSNCVCACVYLKYLSTYAYFILGEESFSCIVHDLFYHLFTSNNNFILHFDPWSIMYVCMYGNCEPSKLMP